MSDTKDTNSEASILEFDPFEGDFGMPGDTVFSNKIVFARKAGPCSNCNTQIKKNERIRRQSSKFDGALMTHRWCFACCAAMSAYDDQAHGEELPDYEKRANLTPKATPKEPI